MNEYVNAQTCEPERPDQPKMSAPPIEDLVLGLVSEYCQLSFNYKKLHNTIIADTADVSDYRKALWNTQLSAMGSYRAVLAERIKDILDQDSK